MTAEIDLSAMPEAIGCVEAERAVLGCMLRMSRSAAGELHARLEPDDFTDPRHRLVLAAVADVLAEEINPDPVLVLAALRRAGVERSHASSVDAGVFLIELCEGAPAVVSAGYYAKILIEHRVRARVLEAAQRLAQVAGNGSLEDVFELVNREWTALGQQRHRLAPDRRPGVRGVAA